MHTITLDQRQDWPSTNHRHHWARRATLARYWRDLTHVKARQAKIPGCDRIRVTVTVHRADRRRYDPGNLTVGKHIIDGLVDAGVVPDDDHTHVIGPDYRHGEPDGVRRLVVTITPLPPHTPTARSTP